ncbi:MAG: SIR2 family protein, partial [Planctomycetota bacterium]
MMSRVGNSSRDDDDADGLRATTENFKSDLRQLIQENKVVVLVGAGLSRNVCDNAPSWVELVRRGIEYAHANGKGGDWCARRLAELDSPTLDLDELFSAADLIAKKLGEADFGQWLEEVFSPLKANRPEAINALMALGMPIMTTNYDDLLTGQCGRKVITPQRGNQMARWLHETKLVSKSVFHLHGHYEDPQTVVFSQSHYDQ